MRHKQSYKYTKNDDGSWEVTKALLDHFGHQVSKQNYYLHEHTKRLNDDDKELKDVKVNNKNIAACLSNKSGKNFKSQDVRNLIKKIDDSDDQQNKRRSIGKN